jgi:hypothetical protein
MGARAMSDRRLLELAAKAAGIEFNEKRSPTGSIALHCPSSFGWWNPLTDDGDALRLAVKLKLEIRFYTNDDVVVGDGEDAYECMSGEPYSATRRAIVKAAAEIGENMK